MLVGVWNIGLFWISSEPVSVILFNIAAGHELAKTLGKQRVGDHRFVEAWIALDRWQMLLRELKFHPKQESNHNTLVQGL